MLSVKSGTISFNKKRCCQCGACLASCEPQAIQSSIDKHGLATLQISLEKCTHCWECVRVCPAHQLPFIHLDKAIWSSVKETGLAWHMEKKSRNAASSGGAARAILAGCLSEGRCEAVYTLMRRQNNPWAKGEIVKGRLDIKQVARSMYLPIPVLENLRFDGKIRSIAIIGTTCQLLAASKLLKGRVEKLIRIAVLCKQQKHLGFTKFIGKRLGITDLAKCSEVEYRGTGWPGQVSIDKCLLDWEQATAIPFGKRLWRIPGCLVCPNPFGYKADITLADPWGLESRNTAGKTMVVAWTDTGKDLLQNTPHLHFDPQLRVANIKRSIDWPNLLRKKELVNFYLGKKVPGLVAFAGRLEKLQTTVLEKGLETVRLPDFLYKVIAHLPDPFKLIPISGDRE